MPPARQRPEGMCCVQLSHSEGLATSNVGPFGSEALGEAVVLPGADGAWSLAFFESPAPDARITLGGNAMVFQAADCLNFRNAPSTTSDVLWCQLDGTRATVEGGPVEADGQTWWQLEGLGWASASFLVPVE